MSFCLGPRRKTGRRESLAWLLRLSFVSPRPGRRDDVIQPTVETQITGPNSLVCSNRLLHDLLGLRSAAWACGLEPRALLECREDSTKLHNRRSWCGVQFIAGAHIPDISRIICRPARPPHWKTQVVLRTEAATRLLSPTVQDVCRHELFMHVDWRQSTSFTSKQSLHVWVDPLL